MGWTAAAEVPERPPPIRDTSLGSTSRAVPDYRVVVSHASVYAAVIALAALEADRSGRVFRSVEVGCMGDHRGDEVGHLAGRSLFWRDVAFFVKVVSGVDHVHGICSSLSVGSPVQSKFRSALAAGNQEEL